jgi:hypothetical protein
MFKKGEFSFVWLFAIVAGGAILFLAIYGAVRFGDTLKFRQDTETAKTLSILLDPLQASFADGSFGKMSFGQPTRINNFCSSGGLGRNEIIISTMRGRNEWSTGAPISISNKYIFSNSMNEGKEFIIFSKPFKFPYKIADMTILISDEYCFLGAPKNIEDEIIGLRLPKVKIENCTGNEIKVCFGPQNQCDIRVYGACVYNCNSPFDEGTVEKDGKTLRYSESLIYPAIFSDKSTYDCNIKRLLTRASYISETMAEKADLMNARSCGSNLKSDLVTWKSLTLNSTADDIIALNTISKELESNSQRETCRLW